MPTFWDSLPSSTLHDVARAAGLRTSGAAAVEDLAATYGPLPTVAFIDEMWLVLRDGWLTRSPADREAVVAKLRALGRGRTEIKARTRAGQIKYLKTVRRSPALAEAVLEVFLSSGSQETDRPPDGEREHAGRRGGKAEEAHPPKDVFILPGDAEPDEIRAFVSAIKGSGDGQRRETWESDYETARRLATEIDEHAGSKEPGRRVDTVLGLFGMATLGATERARIARAFFAVGIEADPPPHAMKQGQCIQLALNARGRKQIFSTESTATFIGKQTRAIGHLVLRAYGPDPINDDHAVVFVNGSGAAITRLEVSSVMSAGTITSSTSHKTFEDIEDGGVVEIERAPGWDDDYLVSYSLKLALRDGSTLRGSASFPPMATVRSPREFVAVLDTEGVVVDVMGSENEDEE